MESDLEERNWQLRTQKAEFDELYLKNQKILSSREDVKTEEETKENAKEYYDAIIDCSNMLNLLEKD